jgi:D-galactonate transporter
MASIATSMIEPEADTSREKQLVRKVGWRLMPLIMICYFFAFFDRINIGFAKAALTTDLGISNTAYGLGASLFVVGYVLFEVPSNMILYKVGAKRWIARIMISWGIATALMAAVSTTWEFYGLRFLVGACEAGFAPGILYYLTVWFPTSHRGRITSMLFVASAFSGVFGAPLAGLILGHMDGVAGVAGWHWLFLFGGVPCVALGFVVLRYLDNGVDDATWLAEDEKALLARSITRTAQVGKSHGMREALGNPGVLLLCLIYFLIQIGSYGLNFWAPDLIKTAGGGSPTLIGLLTAVPYICGVVCMVLIGRHSDITGERRFYVAGCLIAAALGFVGAGVFAHSVALLVVSLGVIGAGIVASVPAFWNLPPKLLSGAGAAGGIALINTLGQLGGIVSPVMVGWIKDVAGSATPALYVIAGLCLVCAIILLAAVPASLRVRDRA